MPLPDENKERSYDGDYMAVGKRAEDIILAWLEAHPDVIGVEDLRPLRVMRDADVDCSIRLMDGTVTLAEIKSDAHLGRSGNMLFEVLRINHTCVTDRSATLGWSARSPAIWLLYYAPHTNQIYRIRMSEFREAMQEYTKANRKSTRIDYVPTDSIKSTVNILIPAVFVKNKPSFSVHSLGQIQEVVACPVYEPLSLNFGATKK
jgi:hypothetical protein